MAVTSQASARVADAPRRPGPARATRRDRGAAAVDVGIAVLAYAVCTLPILIGLLDGRGSPPAIAVLGALAVLPLVVRRRWPLAVLAAVAGVEVVASLSGVLFTPFVSNAGPAVAVAVFTVAERRPRRQSIPASVAGVLAMSVAAAAALLTEPGQDQNAVQLVVALPAWLIGDAVRTRRAHGRRLAEAARERGEQRDARIRAEERLRVSRDVHDVVSHTLSMISVRSAVARRLLVQRPSEAEAALAAIETASRSALAEIRGVLTQTRDRGWSPEVTEPGPADVVTLVQRTDDGAGPGGLRVDYRATGPATAYDPLVETAAYRIVQEALTNAVKHPSAATRVVVTVRRRTDELAIAVVDDGAPVAAPNGTGLGVPGMRERADLLGGSLSAGPGPTRGFEVRAVFPVDGGRDVR